MKTLKIGNFMTITLRDYQEEALNSVIKELQNEIRNQLIVLPTASGKTFVMAAIVKHFDKQTLIIAHREELLQQAAKKIRQYWPEADMGFYDAETKDLNHKIIIGSVQTCCRPDNLKQLKQKGFDLLMIDETHHAPAETYQKIITELGFMGKTEKLLIGVTATPIRLDKKDLSNIFGKTVYSKTAGELIQTGDLAPVQGRRILTNFNLGVRTRKGDFVINELATAVNTNERNNFIVSKFKEYAPDRQAIAFCANVKHCHDLAQTFNTQKIIAKPVWGDMDKDQRKKALEDFAAGKIQVLTSCSILTEGFDEPSITAILMARPTKSKSLYIQMAGRGLRKHPGKVDCLILDFTDQYHNLNSIMSLNNIIHDARYIDDTKPKTGYHSVDRTPRINTLRNIDREFDALGIPTNFFWVDIGDDEKSLTDDNKNEIVISPTEKGYIANLFSNGSAIPLVINPLTLKDCINYCEEYARKKLTITFADIKSSWFENACKDSPSQKQIEILRQRNINTHKMSKAEAYLKIQTIFAHNAKRRRLHGNILTCSQKSYLEQRGLTANNLTKYEAFAMIQKIKQSENYKYGQRP